MSAITHNFVLQRIREKREALGIVDVEKRRNWSRNELAFQRRNRWNVTRQQIWEPLLDADRNEVS